MDNTLDILAHTGDAVCAVNDQQRVVYWNETAAKMLGIAAEEANGQLCWKLMKGKTVDGKPFCSSDCPIKVKLGSQEPVPHFDLWIKHKDNKRILANFSTIMIPQQNGQCQPDQAAIIHLIRAVKSQDHSQYDLDGAWQLGTATRVHCVKLKSTSVSTVWRVVYCDDYCI